MNPCWLSLKKQKLNLVIYTKLSFKILKSEKNKCLYLYNNNFFYWITLGNLPLTIKPELNLVIISFSNPSALKNRFKNQIKLMSYTLTSYFIKKIKIAGKSYRIEKIGRGFNLTVGHTLDTNIFIYNVRQKQTTKHKLVFHYLNFNKIQNNFFKVIYLRLWDVYTQRGLRFGKHKLFKKQGKKSSYV